MSDLSDADVLLAYMTERAVNQDGSPGEHLRLNLDGSYTRNLNVTAAEIGWVPDQLAAAMRELVAQERVVADNIDGSQERFAASRWLVIDDGEGKPKAKRGAAKPKPQAEGEK